MGSPAAVPPQLDLPNCLRLVLPVHLLGRSSLAALLGDVAPVAGGVKLEDDTVVLHTVNRRGSGHSMFSTGVEWTPMHCMPIS